MTSSQLSLIEAARVLGVSPNTVQSWLKSGQLPALFPDDVEGLRKRLDRSWNDEGRRIA